MVSYNHNEITLQELDETWQGMRWILDALHYARDRQIKGGIPLAEVCEYSRSYSDGHCCFCSPYVKDKVTCNGGNCKLNVCDC